MNSRALLLTSPTKQLSSLDYRMCLLFTNSLGNFEFLLGSLRNSIKSFGNSHHSLKRRSPQDVGSLFLSNKDCNPFPMIFWQWLPMYMCAYQKEMDLQEHDAIRAKHNPLNQGHFDTQFLTLNFRSQTALRRSDDSHSPPTSALTSGALNPV